jgi:hypothetical protein
MLIDIADLQWWQTLVAIIGVLGLSPAPWLIGMAFGRIQFSKPAQQAYDARVADLKSQHAEAITALTTYHSGVLEEKDARYAELKESRDYYRTARIEERDRADKATEQLMEVTELTKLTVRTIQSLGEASEDKQP